MSPKTNNKYLEYPLALFRAMRKDNLGYIYRGHFDQVITDHILSLTEANIAKEEQSSKVKKRVYSIMVECLQNITRHQENITDLSPNHYGIFVIQKTAERYLITSGNTIENKNIETVENLITKINSLEKAELKEYYKKVLTEGQLSNKGGAGLGLIDMARKAGNKLSYQFKYINSDISFFYLHTVPKIVEQDESGEEDKSLANIIEIHETLNNENILLIFNGVLDQESLMNLLSSIEAQMKGPAGIKKKVFYIVVEMLQNIVKHGINMNSDEAAVLSGNPGIFFISEKDNEYFITSGNYIAQTDVETLQNKIDHVNTLDGQELDDYYGEALFDFELNDNKRAGLGVIDLRIKSGNKLSYHFSNINDKFAFFTLQTRVIID